MQGGILGGEIRALVNNKAGVRGYSDFNALPCAPPVDHAELSGRVHLRWWLRGNFATHICYVDKELNITLISLVYFTILNLWDVNVEI